MREYCFDLGNDINDIANQVGMRMDLHILGFDCAEFCIAVKSGRAVIHFLQAGPIVLNELIPLYHNSPFDTDGLSIPFIYSRFAWSIFYRDIIRLRCRQKFLIAKEGVSVSTTSYLFKRLEDDEMKRQVDEGHEWNQSEDDSEDHVSEGLEEKPTNIRAVTADDEARWRVRFPFFCEPFLLQSPFTPLIADLCCRYRKWDG